MTLQQERKEGKEHTLLLHYHQLSIFLSFLLLFLLLMWELWEHHCALLVPLGFLLSHVVT